MKSFAAFGVFVVLLSFDGSAQAQSKSFDLTKMTAAELVRACRGEAGTKQYAKDVNRLSCTSYLAGAFDMLATWQKTNGARGLCLPSQGVSGSQMVDAIAGWLEAHQQDKASLAKVVIPLALMDTYGCPKLPLD